MLNRQLKESATQERKFFCQYEGPKFHLVFVKPLVDFLKLETMPIFGTKEFEKRIATPSFLP
jgi:hypothetical protein